MNESFMVHDANMDCNIDFKDISNLSGPDNLNFITNKSNNSSKIFMLLIQSKDIINLIIQSASIHLMKYVPIMKPIVLIQQKL